MNFNMDIDLETLKEKASVGDVTAICSLVDYYISNKEIEKAKLEAERLRFISSPFSYRKLANLALQGEIEKEDKELAKSYFQKAFELGDSDSGYNLALLFIKENKPNEAIPYLTSGISNDHIPSIKLLALLYLKGEGVSKDLTISISLLKRAYQLGDDSVVTSIGKIYYQMGVYDLSLRYFSLGAGRKDPTALYYYALCFAKGLGTVQDLDKAKVFYEMGANLNEPNCLYNLSLYYRNGIGCDVNVPLADKLLDQAIKAGFKK